MLGSQRADESCSRLGRLRCSRVSFGDDEKSEVKSTYKLLDIPKVVAMTIVAPATAKYARAPPSGNSGAAARAAVSSFISAFSRSSSLPPFFGERLDVVDST
jgi:hypothetical protein